MADENGDDIVQRVILTGDKVVQKQFQNIGNAGQQAFDDIGKSADAVSKTFGAQGGLFADTVKNLRGTGEAATDAAAGLEVASTKGLNLAQTLRLLSKATGFRELGRLGGQARALGKAFEVALPAIVIATLEHLASGAAKAAQDFDDLQNNLKVTTPQMQQLQGIANASGLSFEEMSKSMTAVDKLTKDTADGAKKNADEFGNLKNQLNDTAVKSDDLHASFVKLGREGSQQAKDFAKTIRDIGQASLDADKDFTSGLAKIQEQRNDIVNGAPDAQTQRARQLRDLNQQEQDLRDKQTKAIQDSLEKQIDATQKYNDAQENRRNELRKLNQENDANIAKEQEVRRQLAQAAVEAAKNATALDKLGIAATGADGKLKKAPETLFEIAAALEKVTDPEKKLRINQDLVAAGLDRKLIPALNRGVEGFKALGVQAQKINPGFSKEQVKSADDFAIALGQVGDASSALFKQAGIAVAGEFVKFFEEIRDVLIEIRPGIVEFVKTLGDFLLPTLTLIGQVIKNVIVPIFKVFFSALDTVAALINKAFGSNITGMQLFVATLGIAFATLRGGIIFIQLIVVILAKIVETLSKADWKGYSRKASDAFSAIVNFAKSAVAAVVAAWTGITTFFTNLWTGVKNIAQNVWTFIAQGAVATVKVVTDAWNGVLQFFSDLWKQISDSANGAFTAVSDAVNTSVTFVTEAWNGVVKFFTDLWTSITNLANNAWIGVSNAAKTAADFIVGIFTGVRDSIVSLFTSIGDFIVSTWNKVKDVVAKLAQAKADASSGAAGGGAQGFSGGGHIRGPGTSRSDSIPLWGSNGEFMMQARAVGHYGRAFMDAVNNLRFNPDAFQFNAGGLISFDPPPPRLGYKDGGFIQDIGGRNTLNLTLDGERVSAQVDDDNFEKLAKTATRRSLRKAGRAQRWKQ